MSEQLDIFPGPHITRGMVRTSDPPTSIEAAATVEPFTNALQRMVYQAIAESLVPVTAETVERLPRFSELGPSTVRKRISELYQAKRIVQAGKQKNSRGCSMILWTINPGATNGT